MYIDLTVYPDLDDPPRELTTWEEKADYVHRICAAWDFHILPEPETFDLLSAWKDVFDRYPLDTSPAYHAFRASFRWEPRPVPVGMAYAEPLYVTLDRLEGRGEDPCEHMV